ncbi:MAG: hypothetical protein O3C60_16370, partial [Planctomycetota bacterium]|nr:hypothetical protein [Planctomycetota bacterium]
GTSKGCPARRNHRSKTGRHHPCRPSAIKMLKKMYGRISRSVSLSLFDWLGWDRLGWAGWAGLEWAGLEWAGGAMGHPWTSVLILNGSRAIVILER